MTVHWKSCQFHENLTRFLKGKRFQPKLILKKSAALRQIHHFTWWRNASFQYRIPLQTNQWSSHDSNVGLWFRRIGACSPLDKLGLHKYHSWILCCDSIGLHDIELLWIGSVSFVSGFWELCAPLSELFIWKWWQKRCSDQPLLVLGYQYNHCNVTRRRTSPQQLETHQIVQKCKRKIFC